MSVHCRVFGGLGRLSLAAVHSADYLFVSGVWSWIHVSSIATYRRRKSFLPRLNSSKQHSESSTRCCYWSGMSKRGTHFENNLSIPKDLCKIVETLPSDIFKVPAISHNFNLQSPKTIFWTFVMISKKTVDFRRQEHSASLVFVRPRLNSVYQSMIVDFPGAKFL